VVWEIEAGARIFEGRRLPAPTAGFDEPRRFDTFLDLAAKNQIKDARVLGEDAYVIGDYARADGSIVPYNTPLVRDTIGDISIKVLAADNIPTTVDQQNGKRVANLAAFLLPGLILILLFGYMILSYRSKSGLFRVRSGARRATRRDSSYTFDDVAAQDAAITVFTDNSRSCDGALGSSAGQTATSFVIQYRDGAAAGSAWSRGLGIGPRHSSHSP